MLKADLHIHVKGDPIDDIKYTARDVIDRAAQLNYDVLSFTCHNIVIFNDQLKDYAEERGIKLIPGVEKTIHGKHVLIYNITNEQLKDIHDFKDIKKYFTIAPHPYYFSSLKEDLEENIDCFDAIEYSFAWSHFFNPNKEAQRIAKKYNKTMIATSDLHNLKYFGRNYTLIEEDIFDAIRGGRVKIVTIPLSVIECFETALSFLWAKIFKNGNNRDIIGVN